MEKFFKLKSIPGVMFLNGTSFNECKVINNALTLKEYNEANGIKKEKVKMSDKKEKFKPENKSKHKEKFNK